MTAIIAAAFSGLLGIMLGFVLKYWQEKWHRQDLRREAYAEFLMSISASFARAGSHKGTSVHTKIDTSGVRSRVAGLAKRKQVKGEDALEDADKNALEDPDLLKATTVVELLANKNVAEAARELQKQVNTTHKKIRKNGYAATQTEIDETEKERLKIIKLFQNDLDIKPPGTPAWWRIRLKARSHEHDTSSEADESHIQ